MNRRARAGYWVLVSAVAWGLAACRPPRADAAHRPGNTRWVVTPSAIAALSSDHDTAGVPAEIRLGGPLGRSALYLKFPNDWREHGPPLQAFVALSAREGAAQGDTPLTVEAWRVSSDWRPEQLRSWSDKPELAPPYARVTVSNSPARELRVDISELVRFAAENPERDFGLALLASGSAGPGVCFDTGMAGGLAPRLEVYFR